MNQDVPAAFNVPSLVFTAMALVVAGVAAYEDARTGKIKNRLIVGGFAAAAILHVLFILYFVMISRGTQSSFDPGYIRDVFLNTVVALALAIAIWKFGIWSAGDSKLFAVLAFILPLDHYSKGYLPVFPASSLLINIFVVSFLAVVARFVAGISAMVFNGSAGKAWKELNIHNSLSNFLQNARDGVHIFFMVFVIFNIVNYILLYAREKLNSGCSSIFTGLLFLLVIYGVMPSLVGRIRTLLQKLPAVKYLFPVIVIAFLETLYLKYSVTFGVVASAGKMTALFMVVIAVSRKVVETYFENVDVYTTYSGKVKAGMVPTPATQKIFTGEADLDMFFMDGLTESQVTAVRDNIPRDRELTFVVTVPFAPLALAGLLATIILKASILNLMFTMMGR